MTTFGGLEEEEDDDDVSVVPPVSPLSVSPPSVVPSYGSTTPSRKPPRFAAVEFVRS
jgi:hypothetical protein